MIKSKRRERGGGTNTPQLTQGEVSNIVKG